jgi:hypothetical protein
VELYESDRTEIELETSKELSNSLTEMVKFYEETDFKPERDNSDLPSILPLPPSDKEIEIQEYTNKNGQYSSDIQHQQKVGSQKFILNYKENMEIIRKKLLNIKGE